MWPITKQPEARVEEGWGIRLLQEVLPPFNLGYHYYRPDPVSGSNPRSLCQRWFHNHGKPAVFGSLTAQEPDEDYCETCYLELTEAGTSEFTAAILKRNQVSAGTTDK